MNFLNCFVLIVILIQSLLSNFVLTKLDQCQKIQRLNEILANVDIWTQFENITVIHGELRFLVHEIFDINDNINIHQNNTQLLSSTNLHVNQSNYEEKVELIFKFVRCKCWEKIRFCNRFLSYINSGYVMINDNEIRTQNREMNLQLRDLIKRKINEFKELARRLYLYAMFFKNLFPDGKDEATSTDTLFSKLFTIVYMPIPEDDDKFESNLKETLDKSFTNICNSSKNSCVYDNNIIHVSSYTFQYGQAMLNNPNYKGSFAEYMTYYFDRCVRDTCDFFTLLTLNKVNIHTQYSIVNF